MLPMLNHNLMRILGLEVRGLTSFEISFSCKVRIFRKHCLKSLSPNSFKATSDSMGSGKVATVLLTRYQSYTLAL